jgi:hypothetical protein
MPARNYITISGALAVAYIAGPKNGETSVLVKRPAKMVSYESRSFSERSPAKDRNGESTTGPGWSAV